MSRGQRIGLLALAGVVAIAALIVISGGGSDNKSSTPTVERVQVRNGAAVGGIKKIEVKKGDVVRLVVTSDAKHEVHVHGYDILKDVTPGKPAEFRFKADIEGVFEAELEDLKKQIVKLTVNPS
jgi:plastocyanin